MTKKIISKKTRRAFVKSSLIVAGGMPLMAASGPWRTTKKVPKKLRILILGGTGFLGPHQINYAIGRGHEITTFTRGKTKPTIFKSLFDKVEMLHGNREDNLEALKNRQWDVVIDNSGYRTHWTDATANLLKDNVERYLYVSSISVYYPYYKANADEKESIVMSVPEDIEDSEKQMYDYGVMKATSEEATKNAFGKKRSIIVRPHFMVGPADRTNRFMYWPTRMAEGKDVILPGNANDPVQLIDVRDMAEFMIRLLEKQEKGTFNGSGPKSILTMPEFVSRANSVFGNRSKVITMNDYNFLDAQKFTYQTPWIMDRPEFHGMTRSNNQKALSSGLTFRPLETTMRDTFNWWVSDAVSDERRMKYLQDTNELHSRQSALLEAWNLK